MQQTSERYRQILQGEHWFETSLTIGESGRLVDSTGELILIGGDAILVDTGAADSGYREDSLMSIRTTQELFRNGMPTVGSAVAAEMEVTMIAPLGEIPKKARIAIYNRATDGERVSEWIQNGIYYIDTRQKTKDDRGFDVLTVHGYDAMVLADADYPSDTEHDYPMLDVEMVQFIADHMKPDTLSKAGLRLDERTRANMNMGYRFTLPVGYSMREVLCMIAASYGGNFLITPSGELRLLLLDELPEETRVLIDEEGFQLYFGTDEAGERIYITV